MIKPNSLLNELSSRDDEKYNKDTREITPPKIGIKYIFVYFFITNERRQTADLILPIFQPKLLRAEYYYV